MDLVGSKVSDANWKLRLCVVSFMGVAAFGSVLYWRSQLLFASSYQPLPRHEVRRTAIGEMKSGNFQLDVEEFGPK